MRICSLGKKQVFIVHINRCPHYSATGKTLEISQECIFVMTNHSKDQDM